MADRLQTVSASRAGGQAIPREPGYLALYRSGELARRVEVALKALEECTLCPRRCRADRREDDPRGSFCGIGRYAWVSSAFPHHGEEPCLRGWNGSGTIFFSGCNLRCVFCQNNDISWYRTGSPADARRLARLMIRLQELGCHNINFVTPTHVVPQILEALAFAIEEGLRISLVYNTGGYDCVETLRLLEGVVDIYMPDMKFVDPEVARRFARAPDYWEVCRAAVKEMHRQVGDLILDEHGLAVRGLLVRHLVMPNNLAGTEEVVRFLADEISRDTYVNIMAQYRPEGRAWEFPEISRRCTPEEYRQAVALAKAAGLHRLCRE